MTKKIIASKQVFLCGVSVMALMAIVPAHAQHASATTGGKHAGASGLEEIVVTSQKRVQKLTNVPISVTAIAASTLKVNRVTNVTDLAGLAPNVSVREAAGGTVIPAFTIRGITSYGIVAGSDKETSIYLDGVYIGSPRGSAFELPDIERIEILRGPQGTLFGRNATTGAVSIVTRDPTGKLGGHQDLTFGNYNEFRSRTTVDLPSWGPFSAYLSYIHDQRDGDIKNLGAGTVWDRSGPATRLGSATSPSTLGDKDANTYFAAIKFQPSEDFKMRYKFDLANNTFTPYGSAVLGYDPQSPLTGSLIASLIKSQTTPVLIDSNGKRPEYVNNSFSLPGYQHNEGHSLTADYTYDDQLSFKNILAYREAYIEDQNQLDSLGGLTFTQQAVLPAAVLAAYSTASPGIAPSLIPNYAAYYGTQVGQRFAGIGVETQAYSRQYSEELQSNYHSRWVTLTLGGTYFHSNDRAGGAQGIANNYVFSTFPNDGRLPLGNWSTSYNFATSYAGYGQAEFHVLPQLDVVGGVRVTHDDKSGNFVSGGTYVPGPGGSTTTGTYTGLVNSPFTFHETRPTFSAGLNYKPIKDTLAYLKYATGYVSGGAVGGVRFASETVKSWELGFKADLLDHRLRGSLALFNADYDNVQSAQSGANVGFPNLGAVIISQGPVHARGVEAELAARPIDGLTLGASVGYTYTYFGAVNPILLSAYGGALNPTLQPRWTEGMSAQYDTPAIYKDAYLVFRADASYHTRELGIYNAATRDLPGLGVSYQLDPAFLVNARIALTGLRLGGHGAEIALWARNLTNDKDLSFPATFGGFIAASTFVPARTFGIDLSANF